MIRNVQMTVVCVNIKPLAIIFHLTSLYLLIVVGFGLVLVYGRKIDR